MQKDWSRQNQKTRENKRAEINTGKRTEKKNREKTEKKNWEKHGTGLLSSSFIAFFSRIFRVSVFSYRKNRYCEYLCYFKNLFTVYSESYVIIDKNQV